MRYIDLGKTRPRLRPSVFRPSWLKLATVGAILGAGLLLFWRRPLSLADFFGPVSVFSKIINPQEISTTDGRTNILLLALDRRKEIDPRCNQTRGGSGLSDTLIVASLGIESGELVLVSIPRDLWVETGYFSGKINSAYSTGGGGGKGAELVSRIVGGVLGIPIHYYAVVDFSGFKKAVDILGGIEVEVERGFDDYKYPIPGKECAETEEEKWEHIHFDAGRQVMNGEQALKFVRSRHALGPEGSDFARSKRQQKVLLSIKEKASSLSAFSDWDRVKELYQAFEDSVETNLSLWEMERLYTLGKGVESVRTEVLDGSRGLLYVPEDRERFGGAWVLVPRAGDFSEVRKYMNGLLFQRTD